MNFRSLFSFCRRVSGGTQCSAEREQEPATGGVVGAGDPASTFRSSQVLGDSTSRRRKAALARLAGDKDCLDSLLAYELRRHPGATELALLDAVIESLERDQR